MNHDTLYKLFIFAFFVCSTPGPNMLHILSKSMALGARKTLPAMAGCLSGLVILLLISALGLGVLLTTHHHVFTVLKYAGAAYLALLGYQSWQHKGGLLAADRQHQQQTTGSRLFTNGFFVGVSNPKLLLFAVSFMPQFIDLTRPLLQQYAIIIATFVFFELSWYFVYCASGAKIVKTMATEHAGKILNKSIAVIFLGFGVSMLAG